MSDRWSAAGTSAYIYDIEVEDDRRRQGWGRESMTYAEQWASKRGAHQIALNVFGGNTVARGFSTSLGYTARSLAMAKPLRSLTP